jgi:L-fuconolactonase
MIVDAHAHASDLWFEPTEALLHQLDAHNVGRAVLVQQSGTYDNSYIQSWLKESPDRLATVVVVDEADPFAVNHMESLAAAGASGIRLSPTTGTGLDDPLLLWRAAERLQLTISCLGASEEFASTEFARIVEQVPDLPIVLEHLGERQKRSLSYTPEKAAQVFKLARFPNVHVKFHGLGEFSARARPQRADPFVRPLNPILTMAFEAFGADRMMWGSDFPPVSTREGYGLALALPAEVLREHGATAEDLNSAFGGVAGRLFWSRHADGQPALAPAGLSTT